MREPEPGTPNGAAQIATGVAPPHSLDAEMSVLGGVLLSDRALRGLVDEEFLRPEMFYRERHRLIFAAMCELLQNAERPDESIVDVLILTEHLRAKGQLEDVGGRAGIDELTGGVPGLGGIRRYAQIVKEHWVKRTQLSATYQMQAGILNHSDEAYEDGRRMLDQLDEGPALGQKSLVEVEDARDHMFEGLRQKRPRGYSLPWPRLEKILSLRPGHATVLAGWSSVGKSHAAFQILAHVCRKDGVRGVAWITEQTREEHWARQLTRDSGVPYETLIEGDIDNLDPSQLSQPSFQKLLSALAELPFGIEEAHGWPVERICRHIRQVRPQIALLDHFHAMPESVKRDEADNALALLLAAAAQADCHLIIVSQLNNARNDTAKPPPPTRRDLRNTGALEHLPSNVLLVHRESINTDEDAGDDDAGASFNFGPDGYVHVAKQRGGSTGRVAVTFDEHRLRFLEPWRP